MLLLKGKFRNFRGIKDTIEILFHDFTTIVGKNDAGKSTILKGIDLFLNNVDATKEIKNAYTDDDNVVIELFFKCEDEEIIIDESSTTTFKQEELLNEEGILQVKKVWDTSKSRISPDTYLYRKKYARDFLVSNETELITLCREFDIDTRKANNQEFNNVEKRFKLRQKFQELNEPFTYEYEKLPTTGKGRLKLILDALKKSLPRFEYFKADSSLNESDTVIQKYFKTLAEQKLKEFSITTEHGQIISINNIEEFVDKAIGEVLSKITGKINQVVSDEEKVEPHTIFSWANLVNIAFKSENNNINIPLKLRGDGFRRVTMMSYFEYLAEENSNEHQKVIFGFEEPETFLHPGAQETLYFKLKDITDSRYQVILTSHSPVIVANSEISKLVHIRKDGGYTVQQHISDFTDIIKDLGISVKNQFIKGFETAKMLLLLEGIDDVKAFNYLAEKYLENGKIESTFNDMDVLLVPIGGCDSIQHWMTLNLLKDLSKPFFIIQDSDKEHEYEESKNKVSLIELGLKNEEDFIILRKRAIENYINERTFKRIVPEIEIEYDEWTNMKKLCKQHPYSGRIGGKNVAERLFTQQVYSELVDSFTHNGVDEFMAIYNLILKKMTDSAILN